MYSTTMNNDVVELTVGGFHHVTTISTLQTIPTLNEQELDFLKGQEEEEIPSDAGNMLASIASGNYTIAKDRKGRIVIDRDGTYFNFILNYLRENGDMQRLFQKNEVLVTTERRFQTNCW